MRRRNKGRRQRTNPKASESYLWVWEFSKRVVLICTAIYIAEQIYAAVIMWRLSDIAYLGTMMEQCSDIMRTCVFGYFIKAGLENMIKIWRGSQKNDADADEPGGGEEWP